jgi:membrane-associated phospholipid phosphatase
MVLRRRKLVGAMNVVYLLLNSGLSVAWLALLYRRRDSDYHRLRSAFLLAHLLAQPIFLAFPTAPPRALERYVDTLRDVSKLDIDRSPLAIFYNPVAAMPSIHVAYAVVAAGGLAGKRRLALGYPPAVTFVVVATGNHFVLDVLAGAALGAASLRWVGWRPGR